jgi:hypothetical protein
VFAVGEDEACLDVGCLYVVVSGNKHMGNCSVRNDLSKAWLDIVFVQSQLEYIAISAREDIRLRQTPRLRC